MERSASPSALLSSSSPLHGVPFVHRSRLQLRRSIRILRAVKAKPRSSRVRVLSLATEFDSLHTALPLVRTVSTLLYSFTFLLGAAFISQRLATEQDRFENREPCPRCNGTGVEPCVCTRWTDHDVGCGSCNQTGYMACSACGGGGTAVPIPLFTRKDDPSSRRF